MPRVADGFGAATESSAKWLIGLRKKWHWAVTGDQGSLRSSTRGHENGRKDIHSLVPWLARLRVEVAIALRRRTPSYQDTGTLAVGVLQGPVSITVKNRHCEARSEKPEAIPTAQAPASGWRDRPVLLQNGQHLPMIILMFAHPFGVLGFVGLGRQRENKYNGTGGISGVLIFGTSATPTEVRYSKTAPAAIRSSDKSCGACIITPTNGHCRQDEPKYPDASIYFPNTSTTSWPKVAASSVVWRSSWGNATTSTRTPAYLIV